MKFRVRISLPSLTTSKFRRLKDTAMTDTRATKWIRSMASRPAGLANNKERTDPSLWYLLSGGRRNAAVQPIIEEPTSAKNSPHKKDLISPANGVWETEASSNFVYYVTGDEVLAPEEPTALEQANLAQQALEAAESAQKKVAAVKMDAVDAMKTLASTPETDVTAGKPKKSKRGKGGGSKNKKSSSRPKELWEKTRKVKGKKKKGEKTRGSGFGMLKRKKKKNRTAPKPIPERPAFFPYGMNNLDDRLTHNVTTENKQGVTKTALRAQAERAKKKSSNNEEEKKNAAMKKTVEYTATGLPKKQKKEKQKYMKHPPLPLPTPSKAGFCPRQISNPPPEPDIGITKLLMWPGEDQFNWPEKNSKSSVIEAIMKEQEIGWDELPAAGKTSGIKHPHRSPEKTLLQKFNRTPKYEAPPAIDPKEECIQEALRSVPIKKVEFKTNVFAGSDPRNFGHLPAQWTKFIQAAGNVKKKKEPGVADLLGW